MAQQARHTRQASSSHALLPHEDENVIAPLSYSIPPRETVQPTQLVHDTEQQEPIGYYSHQLPTLVEARNVALPLHLQYSNVGHLPLPPCERLPWVNQHADLYPNLYNVQDNESVPILRNSRVQSVGLPQNQTALQSPGDPELIIPGPFTISLELRHRLQDFTENRKTLMALAMKEVEIYVEKLKLLLREKYKRAERFLNSSIDKTKLRSRREAKLSRKTMDTGRKSRLRLIEDLIEIRSTHMCSECLTNIA